MTILNVDVFQVRTINRKVHFSHKLLAEISFKLIKLKHLSYWIFPLATFKLITITSFFIGKLLIPMGVVRSISPPSMSQILSPENPLVIVVSPVLDLWNFGSSLEETSASSCCFWIMIRPVMMIRQSRTPIVTEIMRYR